MSFPKRPHKPKPKKRAPAPVPRAPGTKTAGRPSKSAGGKSATGNSGARKTDASTFDGRRSDARKTDARKTDARKTDTRKSDTRKTDARKTDARKTDTRKTDARKTDARKTDTRKTDARKTDTRKSDTRKSDTRKIDSGKLGARKADSRRVGARKADAGHGDAGGSNARRFIPARPKVARPAAGRFERDEAAASKPPARKRFERPPAQLSSEPHPGMFLLTTREGAEQDLVDELALLRVVDPPARVLAPALVLAPKVPKRDKAPVDLTFARQGFPIVTSVRAHDLEEIASRVARSLRGQLERAKQYGLHVWVPDSTLGNPLASLAVELEDKLADKLATHLPEAQRVDDAQLRKLHSLPLAQVCLMDPERAVAGVSYSNAALSLARGGRTRVRVTGDFPSRAARKLEEALAWLGVEPTAGDLCVDLGAAPGGWTYVLAERRARVIAIDPAKLRPEILARKGVRHVQASAFTYKPDEPVDWLFSDMAWRPLEAAALLAKWGRNKWARMLVSNIKLPMTKKAEILARVRHILETEGNWKHVKAKQLYHDRDEITLTAHLG